MHLFIVYSKDRNDGKFAVTGAKPLYAAMAALAVLPSTALGRPSNEANVTSHTKVENLSIVEIRTLLESGKTTSQGLVEEYTRRFKTIDRAGPNLRSVIAISPESLTEARERDRERQEGQIRGPLHGIPILIKDNIEVAGALPTTAGSLALLKNVTRRDAFVVKRLRQAGAIILGKANLSEWANIRSSRSSSGWSAVGDLVRNPHALDRNACGSSSGSGAAVAASLAAASIGTETDGSITCPSSVNGIVGMKPTVGLVSRSGIVPISRSQDTAGPMARTVEDTAILLEAMAGGDNTDQASASAARRELKFQVNRANLKNVRIGFVIGANGEHPGVSELFERALQDLRRAGAVLVPVTLPPDRTKIGPAETKVLLTELKAGLNEYLKTAAPAVQARSLEEVIAFNKAQRHLEMPWFGQELFEQAQKTRGLEDEEYISARATSLRLAGKEGIDLMLAAGQVEALIAPTAGPAWLTDLINSDSIKPVGIGKLAAVAGYPHLTVPMGGIAGLPVGLSFVGAAWNDGRILEIGAAYERVSQKRLLPTYAPHAGIGRPAGAVD